MANVVDIARHAARFDPEVFGDRLVDVCGCGAVGSVEAMLLARLGVRRMRLWDPDVVESVNLGNQSHFTLADAGWDGQEYAPSRRRPKAEALAERIEAATGLQPEVRRERVPDYEELGDVVFLAVDSMAARRSIVMNSAYLSMRTSIVVDARVGVEEMRVYGFDPNDRDEVQAWLGTIVDNAQTTESACSAKETVGAIATAAAALAVVRFMNWFRQVVVNDSAYAGALPLEQLLMTRPLLAASK